MYKFLIHIKYSLFSRMKNYYAHMKNDILGLPKRILSFFVVRWLGPKMVRKECLCHRKRPKILLLRTSHENEVMMLDHTLQSAQCADFEVLVYDVDLKISPISDLQLIRKSSEIYPDLIVFSTWSSSPTHPSIAALRFIRKTMGIPLASIWWDTCNRKFWQGLIPYIDVFDIHVVVDNPRAYFMDQEHPLFDRFLFVWSPMDGSLFSPSEQQDMLVSFVGRVGSYRDYRKEPLQYIRKHHIDVYYAYTDFTNQLSFDQYADMFRRSKMSVNFSWSVDVHQLKGRVFEIMLSGALLLESGNDQISMLFTPMEDYVPFSSKEDLLDKIHYFEQHPLEMEKIAKNGYHKVKKYYSSAIFWERLLQRGASL